METDTIAAIATAVGEGGVGIVRISGSQALAIAETIFFAKRAAGLRAMRSHEAVYGKVVDPEAGDVLDEALLLWMKGPRSYTCEDVVELQCHGGMLPLRSILALVLRCGARMASPGEFTKRAFLNGRLDLSQAQAVIDIIQAKTEASLKMAVGHLEGRFSARIRAYREEILRLIAHIEAKIDFPEEEIEDVADTEILRVVKTLSAQLERLLQTARTGRILQEGLKTVLAGRPNVGKSSLMNALLKEERAIVTDIAGTTRDTIEAYLRLGGIPLRIVDTAGIRATDNPIEKIGVERSKEFIAQADLVLLLLDGSSSDGEDDEEILSLVQNAETILLYTKADLPRKADIQKMRERFPALSVIPVSSVSGEGLEQLEQKIVEIAYGRNQIGAEASYVRDVRQEAILRQARYHLEEVVKTQALGLPQDFLVVDLRVAWEKLGEITGDTVGNTMLDEIFSRFCIGK